MAQSASIGKNTAVGLATNVVIFGLGILLSVVLARSLGANKLGIYALLVTANGLLANMVNLSLGVPCTTLLARGRYRLAEINTLAALLALIFGALALAIMTPLFPLLSRSIFLNISYPYLLVALLLVPSMIYQIYWNSMMVGLNRLVLMNKFNLGLNIGNTMGMVLLVGVLQGGIPGFLVAWAVTSVAGTIAAFVIAARIERPAWPPNRAALREMLNFGLRVHGTSIAQHLFLRFDMLVVNALVGTAQVGFYSRATNLSEKLWLPINVILASSFAKISQLPRGESALLTAKLARSALLLMLGMAVPFAVVAPWLIPFMYGTEFTSSVLPLVILLFGALGFAVMVIVNNYILGQMERPGLLSIISWLELGVSIPLYLALIAWQGIVGAAIASALTYMLAMACTLYVFVRDSGVPVGKVLVPVASDFHELVRVLRQVLTRVPVLRRYARHS